MQIGAGFVWVGEASVLRRYRGHLRQTFWGTGNGNEIRGRSVAGIRGCMLGAMPLAMAEDAPATGVPELSIAQNWNDPVRAAFAQRGITYGVNWSGEYWNVAKGGNSHGLDISMACSRHIPTSILTSSTGWKGGTIHASAYYLHGVGPSTERANNIFAVSNIEGLETFRLFRTLVRAISAPGQAESSHRLACRRQ